MKLSFSHLKKINQTYTEHAKDALGVSFLLFKSSLAVLAHAVYPDVFEDYASKNCKDIYEHAVNKKNQNEETENLNINDEDITDLNKKED